jgi:hypothetical protein
MIAPCPETSLSTGRSFYVFPKGEPESRANDLLSATADLDDVDLEEIMLSVRFRERAIEHEEQLLP